MSDQIHHFIDGKIVQGQSGRFGGVFNPATGEETKQVALASADETRAAIVSAAAALPGWSATPAAKRAQVMFKFRDLLMTNHDAIAEAISAEHGKTFDDAKGEVARGIEVVEFVCGIPHLMKGEYSDNVASGVDSVGIRNRLVFAQVSPHLTSQPWCLCGCSPWPWHVATHSSSNLPSVILLHLC
jgi:malonate-semialdehyde dehydrogenase (acetylating)/methylmalonate-semialdehyde dehydrogenase